MAQSEKHANVHHWVITYDGILLSEETESTMNPGHRREGRERGKKRKGGKKEEDNRRKQEVRQRSLACMIPFI